MARKLTNEEKEKLKGKDIKYGEKHCKKWKMRKTHYRTSNVARSSKKLEIWEIHSVGPVMLWENEKRRKWDTNIVWPAIWRETLKNKKNEKCIQ